MDHSAGVSSAGPRPGGRGALALRGREAELRLVADLVERAASGAGGALLVRGEAGIGKTTVLDATRDAATARGGRILSALGVQSEALVPFACLHQLLRPVLDHTALLVPQQRQALLTAIGTAKGTAPELFSVALAVLELVSGLAEDAPVVMVVDDAQWIDRSSAEVLAFVAHRLDTEHALMALAVRDGHDTVLNDAGLPELRLTGLDDAAATALLDHRMPELGSPARDRILAEAAGNPLALVELSSALRDSDIRAWSPWLPISHRLERAFLVRAEGLPDPVRSLLLVTAADDQGDLSEILEATALLDGTAVSVGTVEPAVTAGLIELDGHEVRFRHPLIRSAVYQASAASRRLAAHAALAKALNDRPERRAWHGAAASPGPDEDVALDLEAAAHRALDRGAPSAAAEALRRAALLSTSETSRGRLLLRAAELDFELGDAAAARRRLAEAKTARLDDEERLRLTLWAEALSEESWYSPERVRAFAEVANRLAGTVHDGETLALKALRPLSISCWYSNPAQETRDTVVRTARRLRRGDNDPLVLSIVACADPERQAAWVIDEAARTTPESIADPAEQHALGASLTAVWAFDLSWPFLCAAVDGLREQGRLGLLGEALASQAWAAIHLGKHRLAATAADEAARLSRDTGRPRWALVADLATAAMIGQRGDPGDQESANEIIRSTEAELVSVGAQSILGFVQFVRGRLALIDNRPGDAFEQLARVLDPSDIAYHPFVGLWGITELIEAALRAGHDDEARRHQLRLNAMADRTASPYLEAMAAYARPLTAADEEGAEELFNKALRGELSNWPFHRARLLLAHGRRMRRHRRLTESRPLLRAAMEAFDALGITSLGEEARAELRAAGEAVTRRAPESLDQLTPQELQIAKLAATGMTNREIGTRLFLSHRTVGFHLYRVFPKLGITSRGQLGTIDLGGD